MRALFLAQLSNGVIDDYVTSFDRHSGYFQAMKHFGDFRRPMFSLRHLERFDRNRTFPPTYDVLCRTVPMGDRCLGTSVG